MVQLGRCIIRLILVCLQTLRRYVARSMSEALGRKWLCDPRIRPGPKSAHFCSERGKMAPSPLHSRRPWAAVAAPSGAGAREMSSRRPVSPLVKLRTRAGHSLCPCPPVRRSPLGNTCTRGASCVGRTCAQPARDLLIGPYQAPGPESDRCLLASMPLTQGALFRPRLAGSDPGWGGCRRQLGREARTEARDRGSDLARWARRRLRPHRAHRRGPDHHPGCACRGRGSALPCTLWGSSSSASLDLAAQDR